MYMFYLIMVHGQMVLFPKVLFQFADLAVPTIIKAVFARRARQNTELEKALDIINGMSERADAFAQTVQGGHMRDKQKLYNLIDKMVDGNRTSLAEMAKPIGPSVKQLTHFKNTDHELVVDEPLAEVFRASGENLTLDTRCRMLVLTHGKRFP